jgi:hypothetical protein
MRRISEEAAAALAELQAIGINPTIDRTGGGHIAIIWRITADKPLRKLFTCCTGSDWRGPNNARARVRRMLRQDGAIA